MSLRVWDTVRLLLAVAGLAASLYLVYVQATSAPVLGCSASGLVNCEQVLTSPSAKLLVLPLSWWGVAWFVVALALIGGMLTGAAARWAGLPKADLLWTLLGALSVLYFVYLELWVIDAICLWCTAVHVIVLTMFKVRLGTESAHTARH